MVTSGAHTFYYGTELISKEFAIVNGQYDRPTRVIEDGLIYPNFPELDNF